jgi:tripartite-type tricarboxylate transporter receptor subunit TctC
VPAKTAAEYFAYAKANPGKLNFGTSGAGGNTHLAAEWLHGLTRTSVTYVHYKGASPLQIDLTAGRIQATFSTPLTMIPLIKNGTLRALAATSTTRVARLPDIPTLLEQGVAGYDHNFWMGYVAPSATPAAVMSRLNAEFSRVAKAPDIVQKMADEGNQTVGSSTEEFRQYIAAELVRVKKLVQDTGIVPE